MAQTSTSTRKLSETLEIISCCFHESGHALYALLSYCKVSSVSIVYSQLVEGTTYYMRLDEHLPMHTIDKDTTLHIAKNEVMMSFAGLEAEKLFYRDICGSNKFPRVLKMGCEADIKSASETIKRYDLAPPGKKRQAYKRQLQKELGAILTEHWSDLKLISHALYKTKRLSFDDLKKLLTKKSVRAEFWKRQFRDIGVLFDQLNDLDNAQIVAMIVQKA